MSDERTEYDERSGPRGRVYRQDGTWYSTKVRPSRQTANRKAKRKAVLGRKG